jgi:HlyD family secretion protein
MAENNPLFRKAALDKLASPERLDVLTQVTSSQGWLALWTIAAILCGIIAWSVWGSMPERLDGQGILIRGGGLREIRASGDGILRELKIAVNGTVEADQLIGELVQEEAGGELQAAQLALVQAQQRYAESAGADQAQIAQVQATIATNEGQIAEVQARLDAVEADLQAKEDLLKRGLITSARVEQIRSQQLQLRAQITGLKGTIAGLRGQINALRQKVSGNAQAVEAARQNVTRVTSRIRNTTEVRSTVAGRVVEVKKAIGDRVRNGEVIAIAEPPAESATLEPVVYIDARNGKRIHPGMEVQVSPDTVKREEYGFMRGVVQSVGEFPVTPQAVVAAVANEQLANQLLGDTSKIDLRVRLIPNETTPSGFEWSSAVGPPFGISSGTQVSVSVVVDRKAPITKVLPMLKGALGAS